MIVTVSPKSAVFGKAGPVNIKVSPKKFIPKKLARNDIGKNMTFKIVRTFMISFVRFEDDRKISVQGTADEVAEALDDVVDPDEVVVDIAKVDPVLGPDLGVRVAGQTVEHFAHREGDPMQAQGAALDVEDPPQCFGSGVGKYLILSFINRVVEVLDRWQEFVNYLIQDAVEEEARPLLEPIFRLLLDEVAVAIEDRNRLVVVSQQVI